MGRNEHFCPQGFDHFHRVQIGGNIIDEADLILVQRFPAGQAIRQIDHIIRRPKAYHIKEMSRQGDDLKALRQGFFGQLLGVALLGHEEFVPQLLTWVAAIQKGRLQDGVMGKGAVNPWSVNHAPGLALQILIAADVVSVGVGVVDGGKPPAVGFQKLPHLTPCVLIVAAVNQANVLLVQLHQPNFCWTLDVVTLL